MANTPPRLLQAIRRQVGEFPAFANDAMFWQFPARTEAQACELHRSHLEPLVDSAWMNLFLGLPWATWIDIKVHHSVMTSAMQEEIQDQRARIEALRDTLSRRGKELRVHTVCQHVYWQEMLPLWRELGVTDLWLSHLQADAQCNVASLTIHPWHLYAVNVEDRARRSGLDIGKDVTEKSLLASFVGTHMDHYLSDVRLRLCTLADKPRFYIRVTRDKWHFEDVVYGHQIHSKPLSETYRIGESVETYNRVLSDSLFALCPAGAGPNTLRLWEALAVGSVPVLLGPQPALPRGGSLPPIDWDSVVIRVPDDQIEQLPILLRRIPLPEVRRRQRLGMEAYALVREQRCF